MPEILNVGPHGHQWARLGAGGVEECVICHSQRQVTPILSGIGGGFTPPAAADPDQLSLENAAAKEVEVTVRGSAVATDSLTGLPPQSYHSAEPPDEADDLDDAEKTPTVGQMTGFAPAPASVAENDEKADEGSDAQDAAIRAMPKYEMVDYARSQGLEIDESLGRDQLGADIIARRPR